MFTTIQLIVIATLSSVSLTAAFPNSIFVISNAETPSLGFEGLTPVGLQRAQECLPDLFGPSSQYDLGLIVACTPEENTTACHAAVETATPLATALDLNVDTTCDVRKRTSKECVNDVITTFARESTQSILVVWDRDYIDDLFDDFDLENDEPDFPEDSFDVIFTIRNRHFVAQTSEDCPSIDGPDSEEDAPLLKMSANKLGGSNSTAAGGINKNTTNTASASGSVTSALTLSVAVESAQVSASSTSTDPATITKLVRRHQSMRRLSRRKAFN